MLKSINAKVPFKLKNIIENHIVNYPVPASLYYAWSIGSILGILLAIQVFTGVLLAMHYVPHIDEAFSSVERIMREIPGGWFLRYMHSNGSSCIFILLYAHVARGLYFSSYRKPKQWIWCSGVILFILMAGISFLGYTLPWGQMSFWGSTVITNLITAIPFVGQKIVVWVWGGFAINANTLNRFFSLHYFLSIIALALSIAHLILLHMVGSTTPPINDSELDLMKFSPAFVVKDALTFILFLFAYFALIIYKPNFFGDSVNYMRADALVTPAHIVPEWYFLPFYAMLKAFPSKAVGAIAMIASMLILLTTPWMDGLATIGIFTSDPKFRPAFRIIFILFVINMFALGWLGSLAVSDVNQIWMQICTAFYFSYFIIFIAALSHVDWKVIMFNKQPAAKQVYKQRASAKSVISNVSNRRNFSTAAKKAATAKPSVVVKGKPSVGKFVIVVFINKYTGQKVPVKIVEQNLADDLSIYLPAHLKDVELWLAWAKKRFTSKQLVILQPLIQSIEAGLERRKLFTEQERHELFLQWLAGFIEANGSFYQHTDKEGNPINSVSLEISKHSRAKSCLYMIQYYLSDKFDSENCCFASTASGGGNVTRRKANDNPEKDGNSYRFRYTNDIFKIVLRLNGLFQIDTKQTQFNLAVKVGREIKMSSKRLPENWVQKFAAFGKLLPGWISGFFSGDGCFQFLNGSTCKISVSQANKPILEAIMSHFGFGSIIFDKSWGTYVWNCTLPENMFTLINHFITYPLCSEMDNDLLCVIQMLSYHMLGFNRIDNKEGLDQIQDLKDLLKKSRATDDTPTSAKLAQVATAAAKKT